MATGPGYPSSTNTFVPDLEASGRLIMGFSRNPKRFPIADFVEYRKCDKSVFLYLKMLAQEAARVVNVQDYEWPDGQVRPTHEDGLEGFQFVEGRTHRYDYGYSVGYMAKNQADWPMVEYQQRIMAAKLMTARSIRVYTAATLSTNWTIAGTGASGTASEFDMTVDHTDTATNVAGGYLDKGTSTVPYIKIAFDKIEAKINLDTLGIVDRSNLQVVINPNQARLWAESPEIHEFIKGSYWAKEELAQGLQPNNKFGLPSAVYGMKVVVDNTVKVTSRKGATLAKAYAFPDQTAVVCSRVGGIEGVEGKEGKFGPSFSTLTFFWYDDELTVETFDDPKNRRSEGHCVENGVEVVTSPISGYLLTSTTSVAS